MSNNNKRRREMEKESTRSIRNVGQNKRVKNNTIDKLTSKSNAKRKFTNFNQNKNENAEEQILQKELQDLEETQSLECKQMEQTNLPNTPEETEDAEEKSKYLFTTVKCGLQRTIKNKDVIHIIADWVHKVSHIAQVGSLVFNKYLLRCLEKQATLPNFTNWKTCSSKMLDVFVIMTKSTQNRKDKTNYDPNLKDVQKEFLAANIPLLQRAKYDQQLIIYIAMTYLTNFQNSLVTTFESKQKRFINWFLQENKLCSDKWFSYIWYSVNQWEWKSKTPKPPLDQVPAEILEFIKKNLNVLNWSQHVESLETYDKDVIEYQVKLKLHQDQKKENKKIVKLNKQAPVVIKSKPPLKPTEPPTFASELWRKQNLGVVLNYFYLILDVFEEHNDNLLQSKSESLQSKFESGPSEVKNQTQKIESAKSLDPLRLFTLAPIFDIGHKFITIDQKMYLELRNAIKAEKKAKKLKEQLELIRTEKLLNPNKKRKISKAQVKKIDELKQNELKIDKNMTQKEAKETNLVPLSDWSDIFSWKGLFTKSRENRGFEFAHNIQTDGYSVCMKFKKKIIDVKVNPEDKNSVKETLIKDNVPEYKGKVEDMVVQDNFLDCERKETEEKNNMIINTVDKSFLEIINKAMRRIKCNHKENKYDTKEQNPPNKTSSSVPRYVVIDPGRINIIYAVERINTDANNKLKNSAKNLRIHTLTRNEYYRKSGGDKALKKTHRWIEKDNMTPIFTELSKCSLKTLKQENWSLYLATYCKYFDQLWDHKCQPKYSRLKFKKYICKLQCLDKFIVSLADVDGKKDSKADKPIIIYGDGKFASGGKGERSIPNKYVYDRLCKHYTVILASEFRSSQVCCGCHEQLFDLYAKRFMVTMDPTTGNEIKTAIPDPPRIQRNHKSTKVKSETTTDNSTPMEIISTDTVDSNAVKTKNNALTKKYKRQCRYYTGTVRGLKWCNSTKCLFKPVNRDRNGALNILDCYLLSSSGKPFPSIFSRDVSLVKGRGHIGLFDVVRGQNCSRTLVQPGDWAKFQKK